MSESGWTAIVLAGQRPGVDPLAQASGETFKALIAIDGQSMLARVCAALLASEKIANLVILAQDPEKLLVGDTAALANNPKVRLAASGAGIAASIAKIAGSDTAPWPVLVTTADHALLTTGMVEEFLDNSGGADLSIGVGERSVVEKSYPATRRTWLKFSDGHFSGANLFALRNDKVMRALNLWSTVEQDRKKSLSILSRFGPVLLFRALTRTISFANAVRKAGGRLGVEAKPVVMSQAEAVIDVDKPADLELVKSILANARKADAQGANVR
ncbi:NTP transferase domain-containing protein [Pontixanthobacter aquaemixtae]|uniref:NTP transferase domain-containing protein n=1 Tax=Pontixanthobacter aquaemixtae TaxID=1958940 RepID=A0A844ZT00_9SPHN|nr:NTP transferase domain-containing protein [Pontixanthobacter aquaemixtae]MXO90985.1 NTP transferase domain-containing protein [Pontixanthobacter aquaemixtae]